MTKGLFITFEGVEGSGKTTQIEHLKVHLESLGRRVHLTREPGGEDQAEKVRALLMDVKSNGMVPRADFFLFLASRAQHLDKLVIPKVQSGIDVVCDRFEDSTWAYQHFGEGLGPWDQLQACNEFATGGLKPDLKILLDMDPAKGLERKGKDATTRFDQRQLDFHQRVRQGYLQLADSGSNWLVVSADDGIDRIARKIGSRVKTLLPMREEV